MRIGWNPLKRMSRDGGPRRITFVTVTHIPVLAGFHAQSLDVLRLMFASLRANTGEAFDQIVLDNGSCAEARRYLEEQHRAGQIDYLILSRENIGVLAANNMLFRAAPGELLAYADSDVFFHPGWLESSLRVLETFPNAGIVTALPIHHRSETLTAGTLAWAEADPEARLESGSLIPREWIADFCEGTGRELQRYLDEHEAIRDYRISYRGARAYAGASMFQFVARKAVVEQGLPLPEGWLLRGSDEMLARLAEKGYLALSTDGLYIHHLGNTLNGKWRATAAALGVPPDSAPLPSTAGLSGRVARLGLGRRALLKIYDGLFRVLYRGQKPE